MVTYAMPPLNYHLEFIGMLAHIVSHHKEGSLNIISIQNIKYPRCCLRDRAIIKGEIHGPFCSIHPPACTRVQLADELWRLLNKH